MMLRTVCFNGMVVPHIEHGATFADLSERARRRKAQGYRVTMLHPKQYEINSDGLVDDRMGWLELVREKSNR